METENASIQTSRGCQHLLVDEPLSMPSAGAHCINRIGRDRSTPSFDTLTSPYSGTASEYNRRRNLLHV